MSLHRLKAAASLIALVSGLAGAARAQDCFGSQTLTADSELEAALMTSSVAEGQLVYRLVNGGKSVVVGIYDDLAVSGDAFSPALGNARVVVAPSEGWGEVSSDLITVVAGGVEYLAWNYEYMATVADGSSAGQAARAVLAGEPFGVRVTQTDGTVVTQTFQLNASQPGLDAVHVTNAVAELKGYFDRGECTIPEPEYDPYYDEDEYYGYGCFLTTASVGAVGLADDCWELRTLRGFRDGFLSSFEAGRALVEDYYVRAPRIVDRISARDDSRAIWLKTYFGGILPSAIAARLGWNGVALRLYRRMTERLEALAA